MSAVYRCDRKCPVYKRCFICKTDQKLPDETVFIFKCPHLKQDIPILAKDALVKAENRTRSA